MKHRRKTILISVDHKWRDLAGYVYAKALLQHKGYRVILVRNNFEEYYCDVYNPCAVVMIHLYDPAKQVVIKRMKQRGITVLLMPTEGIPTIEGVYKLAAGYFCDLSGVDTHFLWNREMRRIMLEGNVLDEQRLCVVGVPRFDFYRDPLRRILPSREELAHRFSLPAGQPVITWTTNFTHASFHTHNRDFLHNDWKKLQVDRCLDADDVARRDHASREMYFDQVVRLVSELQNVSLLIKLHPSEDHTWFHSRVATLAPAVRENIRVVTQQYIWDVLNGTDVLLARSCTTAVEAWLLDKPTIELHMNPDEWYHSDQHASGSNEVASYDELKKWTVHYLDRGVIDDDIRRCREQFISKWCDRCDGRSTQRFVTKIDEIIRLRVPANSRRMRLPSPRTCRSLLIVALMELTNFRLHNWRVYGFSGRVDKLGRIDKYFDRRDERYWTARLAPVINGEESQR